MHKPLWVVGASIKGGGVTDANKHFVGVIWGRKEEFPSFKAVANPFQR